MARPSSRGGKTSKAKGNTSPAMGGKTAKIKPRIAPAANRVRRRSASDPSTDLKEAREQQAATAEILKVIASSPDDVQPVVEAVAERAMNLLDAWSVVVTRFDGELLLFGAARGALPDTEQFLRHQLPRRPEAAGFGGRSILERSAINVSDALADPSPQIRDRARMRGFRAALSVPMLRDGQPIGAITVTRRETGAFAANEIELLQTFADQAVIAIENVRQFNDTKEALERQTATADILKVIASSPSDVQPVFDTIATSSKWLIGAFSAVVFRFVDGVAHVVAFTPTSPAADQLLKASFPRPVAEFPPFERAHAGGVVQVSDTEAEPDERMKQLARARGFRSVLNAPLMSKETPLGMITVTRKDPGPFADHHVQLLQTFADQAVIAIENVRLFDEVQARTRDLTEALTYQTGSSNILRVIASSPTDVAPVLKAIVESACELCDAKDAVVLLKDGDGLLHSAHHGPIPVKYGKLPINRNWATGRAILDKVPVHVHDLLSPEGDQFPLSQVALRQEGYRTVLSVPMLREGESIGVIVLRRAEVHPFGDKQIALLQTFADQAVIAIGNVRMFDEVQAKTGELAEALQQQTATAEVLKAISRSAFDLETVLTTLTVSAKSLCSAASGVIYRREGNLYRYAASHMDVDPAYRAHEQQVAIQAGRGTLIGRVALEKGAVQIADAWTDPEYEEKDEARLGNVRAMLGVPLMLSGEPIGAFALARREPMPFSQREVELVTTFADQAVIATENARLFDEVQRRTRELSLSLEELRTAQDRLVQTEKLASLGQLTAGIAHEIKNPLNFVNNFSGLSIELIEELKDVVNLGHFDSDARRQAEELIGLLKSNLEKVVQHGGRADSIVKNMLLHSRTGSGEHRSTDINALVEDSFNLAYHGARAERPQFNIVVQQNLDPDAGAAELYPQEITRVLLNLISNGFYAANKRKIDGDENFEATISATTRDLGNQVEIRIRDNGTGIPLEVKDKIFNPFFTTKPAGEGTGLGLSMSHDIIVKQHGGKIEVDTTPGAFTEFIITLPRTAAAQSQARGKN